MNRASDEVLRTVVATVRPAYEIPHDDLVGEVLIPAMRCAQTILIGAPSEAVGQDTPPR